MTSALPKATLASIRTAVRRISLALTLLVMFAPRAWAGPEAEATVRVSGTARLEARATRLERAIELRGRLFDDAGRAVPGSHVRIRRAAPDGAPAALPKSEPCDSSPATHDALGFEDAPDEAVADTDASGRYCIRWEEGFDEGRLSVVFDEGDGLLDRAEMTVEVGPEPAARLVFTPVPHEVSADRPSASFVVESRGRPAGPDTELELELLWTRAGAPTSSLATKRVRVGEAARFEVPTRALGGPGAGELRAILGGAGSGVEAWTKLVITATAELAAPASISADTTGDASVGVHVTSRAGAVDSGTVEALAEGRTIGVAPVVAGQAELELGVGTRSRRVPVSLRYWPAAPFYRAGANRDLVVVVPVRSGWARAASIMALLAIALGIVAAWRRPRPSPRPTPAERPATPRAALHWSAPVVPREGWAGVVVDTHDGRPIAAATIAFSAGNGASLCSTTTNAAGEFACRLEPGAAPAAEVRVEAPWHATLARPAPPPGDLRIELVTRRRQLLSSLVEWARGRDRLAVSTEPTPGEVARAATDGGREEVAAWARAVEAAAFGPDPLDARRETSVRELEPRADTPDAPH